MQTSNRYWFPAKRRGYGWGPPTVWQGWAVLVGMFVTNAAAGVLLVPAHVVAFLCVVLSTVIVMLVICYVKGEPPEWR